MKKTTVWLALLAFCGTNTPVAAVVSSQELMRDTVSIDKEHWAVDLDKKTITSKAIFQQGKSFSSYELKKIFNGLAKFLNESNNNKEIYDHYKIYIGNFFLSGYAGETIDLSPIAKHIHRIGNGFLEGAKNLREFDTRDFTNLKKIGAWFLAGATSLELFDARGLGKLIKIGEKFLANTHSLETLNRIGLNKATKGEDGYLIDTNIYFTYSNNTITSRDLLKNGSNFSSDAIKNIFKDLGDFLNESNNNNKKVRVDYNIDLGTDFLSDYLGKTIDFSPIAKYIRRIRHNFLADAKNLEKFDARDFTNLEEIEDWFLARARSLKEFDARGMGKLTKIGKHFLYGAESLTSFNTKGLSKVTKTGESFLSEATKLKSFDTNGLSRLENTGRYFLSGATNLTSFDTNGLISLKKPGRCFLSRNLSLNRFVVKATDLVRSTHGSRNMAFQWLRGVIEREEKVNKETVLCLSTQGLNWSTEENLGMNNIEYLELPVEPFVSEIKNKAQIFNSNIDKAIFKGLTNKRLLRIKKEKLRNSNIDKAINEVLKSQWEAWFKMLLGGGLRRNYQNAKSKVTIAPGLRKEILGCLGFKLIQSQTPQISPLPAQLQEQEESKDSFS